MKSIFVRNFTTSNLRELHTSKDLLLKLSSFLFSLIFFVLILLPQASFAVGAKESATNGNTRESRVVKSTGYGTVIGEKVVEARNMAIADALRKAVEQAVGSVVSSETLVESYTVLKETVYTRSEGFIRSYEILNELQGKNIYTVTLSAVVETGAIIDDLDRTGVTYARAGRPRVLFMISETPVGGETPEYWWGKKGKGVSNRAESALKESFLKSGFTVIDPAALKGGRGVYSRSVTDIEIRKIASGLNAELVIKGSATVTLGARTPGSALKLYMVEMSVSAVRADTAEVFAQSTVSAMLKHVSDTRGPALVIKKAVDKLSKELIESITERWAEPATVLVRLRGVADYKDAVALKSLLKRRVAGVEAVYPKGFKDGVAYFELHSELSADSVAAEISRLLSLSYKVIGTTANTIDLIAVKSK